MTAAPSGTAIGGCARLPSKAGRSSPPTAAGQSFRNGSALATLIGTGRFPAVREALAGGAFDDDQDGMDCEFTFGLDGIDVLTRG